MPRKAITIWVRKRYPKNEIDKLEEELNRKKYEQKEDERIDIYLIVFIQKE